MKKSIMQTLLAMTLILTLPMGCVNISETIDHAKYAASLVTIEDTYTEVIKIIEKHAGLFTEVEMAELEKNKELFDIISDRLDKLKSSKVIKDISGAKVYYDDIENAWRMLKSGYSRVYGIVASKIPMMPNSDAIILMEFDRNIRVIDEYVTRVTNTELSSSTRDVIDVMTKVLRMAIGMNGVLKDTVGIGISF